MKVNKIIFWIATGLLSALMLMSASMYFFNYGEVSQTFVKLGYPTVIVYPLAIAKILGVIAITTRKVKILTQLAYAGFLINFTLALVAHLMAQDGEFTGAVVALVLLATSFFYSRKL